MINDIDSRTVLTLNRCTRHVCNRHAHVCELSHTIDTVIKRNYNVAFNLWLRHMTHHCRPTADITQKYGMACWLTMLAPLTYGPTCWPTKNNVKITTDDEDRPLSPNNIGCISAQPTHALTLLADNDGSCVMGLKFKYHI